MSKNRRRAQAPKVQNKPMHDAMVELRQGSRTSPHRNRARYSRNDYRNMSQNGRYDD